MPEAIGVRVPLAQAARPKARWHLLWTLQMPQGHCLENNLVYSTRSFLAKLQPDQAMEAICPGYVAVGQF